MPIRDLDLSYGQREWLRHLGPNTVGELLEYTRLDETLGHRLSYRVAVTHGTISLVDMQTALRACGIDLSEMPRWVTQYV